MCVCDHKTPIKHKGEVGFLHQRVKTNMVLLFRRQTSMNVRSKYSRNSYRGKHLKLSLDNCNIAMRSSVVNFSNF